MNNFVRFAYTANPGDGTVSIFSVEEPFGRIRARGYQVAGVSPVQVLVSPDQRFLFAPSGSGTVGVLSIDELSGRLTPVAGSPFTAGSGSGRAIVHPSGSFLYVANNGSDNVSAFSIDDSTGVLTPIGSPVTVGDGPTGITASPDGTTLYVLNQIAETVSTLSINPSTGALTPVGSAVPTAAVPASIAVNPNGSALYVGFRGDGDAPDAGVSSYAINPSTGELTAAETELTVGPMPEIDTDIAVTPSGKHLVVTYLGASDLRVYATGPSGALTAVAPAPHDVGSPGDVTIDQAGKRIFVSDWPQEYVYSLRIDDNTGLVGTSDAVVCWRSPQGIAVASGSQPIVKTSRYALVTNTNDDTVSTYGIDETDGTLVPAGTTSSADTPVGVGLSLDGSFAFISSETTNGAASYDADPLTGDLVATGSSAATGTQPLVVAPDPTGRFVYTSNFATNNISRLSVSASGALAVLGTTTAGTMPLGLAMHPTGAYLYVAERGQSSVSAYSVNPATGALTKSGFSSQLLTGTQPTWVTVAETGRSVFVTNFGSNDVSAFGVDTLNNGLSTLNKVATGAGPFGAAADPQGQYLFVANSTDNTISRFSMNSSGSLTSLGAATPCGGTTPMTLAVDGAGERLYVVNQDSDTITVFAINRANGGLTLLGDPVPTGDRPATIVVHTEFE